MLFRSYFMEQKHFKRHLGIDFEEVYVIYGVSIETIVNRTSIRGRTICTTGTHAFY